MPLTAVGLLLMGCLSGCAGETDSAEKSRGDCNPVDSSHCLLPYPSSFFLASSQDTPSDWQVDFGDWSLPETIEGVQTDPERWNRLDGFPTLGPLVALLAGVDSAGLHSHLEIGATLTSESTSLILDASSGLAVPHFAELDAAAAETPDRQAIVLRPVRPMVWQTRHIVALRDLRDLDGVLLEAPEGFAVLRDGLQTEDPDLIRQRARYDSEIFPALEAAGWDRDSLQLAWDFRTVSEEGSLATVRHVVEGALAWAGEDGPPYAIGTINDYGCDGGALIGRQVEGTLEVPLYLETWEPGGFLRFGPDGLPVAEGTVDVPFMARVPCALLEDPRPELALQFGHGLFGDRKDVRSGSLDRIADALPAVLLAVDWTGMKDDDIAPITLAIATDVTDFSTLPDRLHHGHMETLMAARALRGALGRDPAFQSQGQSLIDPSAVHFYGNSQGSVLGGATLALGTDYDRGVLGVPGAPFSLLMPRAQGFLPFFFLLEYQFADPVDVTVLIPLMQMLWDSTESGGHMPLMQTPVLKQAAIGDASVTPLGAHVMARGYGSSLVAPATREIWGLEERTPPFVGSALVEWDFGVEDPLNAVPADPDLSTHDNLFGNAQAQTQVVHFFRTGEVIHVCDGPCDPD
jgi:hypothetical protein